MGRELMDRYTSGGRLVRAVSGFDATFSAPKSLSVWWALSGDARYADVMETALYNGFLSSVSLDGQSYFYVNPLASDGRLTLQPYLK